MLSKKKFGEHKKSCQKFYIFFFFLLFFVFFVVCLVFFFFNKNWSQRVEAVHLDRHDCRLNFNPEALEKARANCGLRTRCVMELLPASASSPQPSPVVVAVANPFDAAVFVSATLSAPATTPAARTTSCSVVSHKKNTHTTAVRHGCWGWVSCCESETLQPHGVQIHNAQTFLSVTPAIYHADHLFLSPQKLACQSLTLGMFTLWGLKPTVSIGCLLILIINQFVINLLRLKHDLLNQVSKSRLNGRISYFIAFFSQGKVDRRRSRKVPTVKVRKNTQVGSSFYIQVFILVFIKLHFKICLQLPQAEISSLTGVFSTVCVETQPGFHTSKQLDLILHWCLPKKKTSMTAVKEIRDKPRTRESSTECCSNWFDCWKSPASMARMWRKHG